MCRPDRTAAAHCDSSTSIGSLQIPTPATCSPTHTPVHPRMCRGRDVSGWRVGMTGRGLGWGAGVDLLWALGKPSPTRGSHVPPPPDLVPPSSLTLRPRHACNLCITIYPERACRFPKYTVRGHCVRVGCGGRPGAILCTLITRVMLRLEGRLTLCRQRKALESAGLGLG